VGETATPRGEAVLVGEAWWEARRFRFVSHLPPLWDYATVPLSVAGAEFDGVAEVKGVMTLRSWPFGSSVNRWRMMRVRSPLLAAGHVVHLAPVVRSKGVARQPNRSLRPTAAC
jgi:hypothetical protein